MCFRRSSAPLGPSALSRWFQSGFKFIHPWAVSRRMIRRNECPLCGVDCSPEMLAIQTDTAHQEENDKLTKGRDLYLEDVREREDRAEFDLPREEIAPPSRSKSAKRRGES